MAKPIPKNINHPDPRIELQTRLQNASVEHAEAILSGLETLQCLHECGAMEFVRGLLGSSDEVLQIAVDAARTPSSIRGIRNLILLINMFSELDPETLKAVTRTLPQALKSMSASTETPSTWRLFTELLRNQDTRRGLGAMNKVLATFGHELSAAHGAQ